MKGVPLKLEDNYPSDEEVDDWDKWCPDPVDVDPGNVTWIYDMKSISVIQNVWN